MPNLIKFQGHLVHPFVVDESVPLAEIANTNDEDSSIDIVIMPEAMLFQTCGGCRVLPILKSYDFKMIPSKDLAFEIAGDGHVGIILDLYNAKAEMQETQNQLDRGYFHIKDLDDTGIDVEVMTEKLEGNYGIDGVLLKPTISIAANIDNNSGGALPASSFNAFGYLIIDWVEVSNAEFEEYLKELFFMTAIGLEG